MDIIKGRVHFDNAPGVEAFHDTRAYELLVASKLTQAISLLELVSNEDCRGLFEQLENFMCLGYCLQFNVYGFEELIHIVSVVLFQAQV